MAILSLTIIVIARKQQSFSFDFITLKEGIKEEIGILALIVPVELPLHYSLTSIKGVCFMWQQRKHGHNCCSCHFKSNIIATATCSSSPTITSYLISTFSATNYFRHIRSYPVI